jgi:hypothetical protein
MGIVLISATMLLVIGFVYGCWFRRTTQPRPYKDSSERAAYHRSQQCIDYNIDSQEGGLDLIENVAYVSTQQIKTIKDEH